MTSRPEYVSADSPLPRTCVFHRGYDLENGGECLCLTGYDPEGNAVWGKYLGE